MFPAGDATIITLNWKLRQPPGYFGLHMPLNQQAKKGVNVFTGAADLDDQMEIEPLFHNEGKKESVWTTDIYWSTSWYYHAP